MLRAVGFVMLMVLLYLAISGFYTQKTLKFETQIKVRHSVEKTGLTGNYIMFTNPTTHKLFLDLNHMQPGNYTVSLYDIYGNIHSLISGKNNLIETGSMQPGVYYVHLKGKDLRKLNKVVVQ